MKHEATITRILEALYPDGVIPIQEIGVFRDIVTEIGDGLKEVDVSKTAKRLGFWPYTPAQIGEWFDGANNPQGEWEEVSSETLELMEW